MIDGSTVQRGFDSVVVTNQLFNELLDLAAETGNAAIMDLLVEFDVRKMNFDLQAYREYRGRFGRRSKYSN